MNIKLNEQTKNRIVGVGVIISIIAIFMPALIKKSAMNMADNSDIVVKIPPRPAKVKISKAQDVQEFKETKLARVNLGSKEPAIKNKTLSANGKYMYTIQAGSFSMSDNAERFAKKLKNHGFTDIKVKKTKNNKGTFFVVYVGQSKSKTKISRTKKMLQNKTNINGFLINTKMA